MTDAIKTMKNNCLEFYKLVWKLRISRTNLRFSKMFERIRNNFLGYSRTKFKDNFTYKK